MGEERSWLTRELENSGEPIRRPDSKSGSGAVSSFDGLAEVGEEDDVAGLVAFGEEELLAVAGPGEVENAA